MEKKTKNLAINTVVLGIGQFFPKILAIITLPILTKYFTTSEYGIYDLIISISSLALPLLTLLIQQAVFRFLIKDSDLKKQNSYIANSLYFILILGVVWLGLLSLVSYIGFREQMGILVLIYLLYFLESIYDLFGQIARGVGKNIWFTAAVIVYSTVNMLILVLAAYFKVLNITNVVLILTVSYLAASLFLGWKLHILKRIKNQKLHKNTIKKMLKYSIPIIPSSISLWIVNLSDRLLVTGILGTDANGIYAAASKIPNLFATAYNVFNLSWTELAARSINEKDISKYYSALFQNLYSFLIGCLNILIIFSPILFHILIDEKFLPGLNQMPILFLGILTSSLTSFCGALYIALEKTKKVGISSFVGAILNIIINLCLIKEFGLYAASISTFVSFLIILLYRIKDLNKYCKLEYSKKEILLGITLTAIVIACFYLNYVAMFSLGLILTVVYNLKYNCILKFGFQKIKSLKSKK